MPSVQNLRVRGVFWGAAGTVVGISYGRHLATEGAQRWFGSTLLSGTPVGVGEMSLGGVMYFYGPSLGHHAIGDHAMAPLWAVGRVAGAAIGAWFTDDPSGPQVGYGVVTASSFVELYFAAEEVHDRKLRKAAGTPYLTRDGGGFMVSANW